MSRNNRAKKPKGMFSKGQIEAIKKAEYGIARDFGSRLMEIFYAAFAYQLSAYPYNWSREKYLRFKKKVDRTIVTMITDKADMQQYYGWMADRGISRDDVLLSDREDFQKYFAYDQKVKNTWGF